MYINARDRLLVFAFLMREAQDFEYKERTPEDVAKEYMAAFELELSNLDGGANYLKIHSMTNLGQTDRRLDITPHPFDSSRDVVCYLPPAPVPKGKIHFHIEGR